MKNLLDILKENIGDGEFLLKTVERKSYELFFVHEKLETVRSTSTTDKNVTVYMRHGDFIGDYSFPVYASSTEKEIIEKISAAKEQAKKINNKAFNLPEKDELEKEIPSSFSNYSIEELGERIASAVFKADIEKGGSINATEIFVYKTTFTVDNSNGLHKSQTYSHAFVEAIPTWTENGDSVEIYESFRFNELDEKAITAEITARMKEVRDRYHAKAPEKKLSCPVVLRAKEFASVIGEIKMNLLYQQVYFKSNVLNKGDKLQSEKEPHDPLNVELKHYIKGNVHSSLFDGDGSPYTDVKIIKDGEVVSFYGGNRFAQYLGENPTGNLPCVEVECGSMSEGELKKEPYLECASMSGIQVDLMNDYIGGEVRLAYLHDGEKTTPLTGITISGSLRGALAKLRLSDKASTSEEYCGASFAVLYGIDIL